MGLFQLLFILFLIVPIVEIYLLIEVGSMIGALPTVGLVVFTAILGVWLLRIQGFATLARVRSTVARGGIPAMEMLEGAVLLISGALLLTPGFFTDAIGFFCLVPAFRRALIRWVLGRFLTPFNGRGGPKGPRGGASGEDSSRNGPTTLEGEFRREDD
ncbi:MAG: FxsA family protein [Gammaproteobacteria bacterium]|nr:FxsA family protein [Gammaproteobacteria bacterium]